MISARKEDGTKNAPRTSASILAVVLMAASPLLADASSVTLTGVVKEQAGGPLPGATVTVTNQGQGTSSTGITDARGEYRVPLLRPDTYTVKVTMAGFQEESRADITLAVGSTARVDFSMRLIEQLDLASGRRVLIREVAPADRTGVLRCFGAALTDDTKSYAYGYMRRTSQLFVVEGAR
jgi:Carboxypeptidase regulatory-like domain